MPTAVRFLAPSLIVAIAAVSEVRAATFNATIGGADYTVVEIDPFPAGGSAGNTTREDGSGTPWASDFGVGDDGLWYQRTYAGFSSAYTSLPGATDRVYEASWENAAALRVDVAGLPAAVYEVFLLYTSRTSNDFPAGTQAALNDLAANGTFYSTGQAIANLGAGPWSTSIASLGYTEANATEFFVGIDEFGGADQSVERSHVLAVAYRQAVPEPASAVTLAIGAAGVLTAVRRKRETM